jgi:hypothetical protein
MMPFYHFIVGQNGILSLFCPTAFHKIRLTGFRKRWI